MININLLRAIMKGSAHSFTLIMMLIYSANVFTEESGSIDHLFSLSLKELLAVKVSIASSESERIIETPAIASRYEASDMAAMGLRTLKDVLSFIPGFVLQDTRVGGTAVMIRGLVDGFNQKVLFLIDDVPYWMPSHSEIPLLGIPIESISHVEVIRGPGAVYYGSNASAGVIKVVTKKTAGNIVSHGIGSNGLRNTSGYIHNKFNDQSSFSLAFEVQREDGYKGKFKGVPRHPGLPDTLANDGEITKSEEMTSFLARYTYQNFNILAQTYSSLRDDFDDPTPLLLGDNVEYTGHMIHVDQTWKMGDADIIFYSDYNQFYLGFDARSALGPEIDGEFRFDNNGEDNNRWRSGGRVNYTVNDSLSLFGGMEYERREIEDYTVLSSTTGLKLFTLLQGDSSIEQSAFGQVDVKNGQWRFILGGRYTDNSQSGQKITPRTSVVYKIDESQSFKILYSVGFNSPNFGQLGITIDGLTGNPELNPEIVKTLDLGYSYESNNNFFVANAYYIEAEDFIQRQWDITSKTIKYFLEDFNRYGLELDFQHANLNYLFFANATYNYQGDSLISGDTSAHFVPKVTTSIGGLYYFNSHHSSGASMRYTGDRNQAADIYQLNLNYQYKQESLEFYTTLRNLLDESIITPDVQDFADDHLIPSGDGINILIGVKYYF